jgi:hypothetical protein
MSRRSAAERRALGLFTAVSLAVLLSLGLTWLGDWSVQWPVLLVPLVWALAAVLSSRERL